MLCGYPPFYGECDQGGDCGWNQGLPCPDCQETLFAKIQLGTFDFPPQEWTGISQDAKNLITHLLVRRLVILSPFLKETIGLFAGKRR